MVITVEAGVPTAPEDTPVIVSVNFSSRSTLLSSWMTCVNSTRFVPAVMVTVRVAAPP